MKKTLFTLGALTLLSPLATFASFSDVPEGHENRSAIEWSDTNNVVGGYPDGSFKPDQEINRAEFTKIIVEATTEESDISGSHCFSDITDEWFAKYVCTAKRLELIDGYPDGSFKPEQNISFVEAAKIIANGLSNEVFEEDTEVWFRPFVQYLSNKKAIPVSILELEKNVNRGEVVEIIWRVQEHLQDKEWSRYIVRSNNGQNRHILKRSLGGDYVADGNDVYVYVWHGSYIKVKGADLKSFEGIDIQDDGGSVGKDRNHVYFEDIVIPELDVESFEMIENSSYGKDLDSVYIFLYLGYSEISGVDIDSFQPIYNTWWSKDKNNVYFNDEEIKGADPQTFQALPLFINESKNTGASDGLAVDKNNFYMGSKIATGISPIQDKEKMYMFSFFASNSQGTDGESRKVSFGELLEKNISIFVGPFGGGGGHCIAIQKNLFCRSVNTDTFKHFSIPIDKYEEVLQSFPVLEGAYFKKDNKILYFHYHYTYAQEIEVKADIDTFTVIPSTDYAKDNTLVFYAGAKMEGVDTETFEIIENSEEYDAEDKNYYYKNGKNVKTKQILINENKYNQDDIPAIKLINEYFLPANIDNIENLEIIKSYNYFETKANKYVTKIVYAKDNKQYYYFCAEWPACEFVFKKHDIRDGDLSIIDKYSYKIGETIYKNNTIENLEHNY